MRPLREEFRYRAEVYVGIDDNRIFDVKKQGSMFSYIEKCI